MSIKNSTKRGTCELPKNSKAFESLKIDFGQAVKKASLKTYRDALDIGFKYLEDQAGKHDLYTLKGLFASNKGKEDLCNKIQSYLVTNIDFRFYRYPGQRDNKLLEDFTADLTKYEARNILKLIRCYEISKNVISEGTKERINETRALYEYINKHKKDKTLPELYELMPDIKRDRIKDIYKGKRKFSFQSELNRIIRANLYLLTYDHKRFTSTEKNGRVFNALTSLSRIYRENEFAFQLREYDIKSANPQIIDRLFNFSKYKCVYKNIMQAYNIDRDKAKELFNSTLNNHRLSRSQAERIYLQAGYTINEAKEISRITAEVDKGSFYRFMSAKESEIINEFIGKNFNRNNVIRLHDAIFYEPEFIMIDEPITSGIDYSQETIRKANLSLDLKMNIYKVVLTAPGLTTFIKKQYFDKAKANIAYKAKHFTFYDRDFRLLSANFNINAPIYEDKTKRTPTEPEFIDRLKQLYRTLLYFNEAEDVNEIFINCIEAIADQEGISFNKNYVYTIMEQWSFKPEDGLQYIKQRNWTYFGGKLGRYKFQSLYYSELSQYKQSIDNKALRPELKKLITALQSDQLFYIDAKKFKRSRSTNTDEIIAEFYKLIGVKKESTIRQFNEVVQKNTHPNRDNLIGRVKNCTSKRKLATELKTNRRSLDRLIYIFENKEEIIQKLKNAYSNLNELPELKHLFSDPVKTCKPKPVNKERAFAHVEHEEALAQWNKLTKYQKNIYFKKYANGFLGWKEENYTPKAPKSYKVREYLRRQRRLRQMKSA